MLRATDPHRTAELIDSVVRAFDDYDTDVVRYDSGPHSGSENQCPIDVDLCAKGPGSRCLDRIAKPVHCNGHTQTQHHQPCDNHSCQQDTEDHADAAGEWSWSLFHESGEGWTAGRVRAEDRLDSGQREAAQ
jgi:hypothetical protein